jgi:RNA polymerase sigma-70 factor (ECF subfamily)
MSDDNLNNNQTAFDAECIRGIIRGNAGSFENLFNFYCQPLISFSRRYVLDRQVAENIVQDIFVRIWTKRSGLDPDKSIKSYLFTSVKNESLKYIRHQDVEKRSAGKMAHSNISENNPEEVLNQSELEAIIKRAISELPEKCREIFTMNRFDNLKYSEIAGILNISVKTVETQMGRALKKLRERLKPFLMVLMIVSSTIYTVL